MYAVFHKKYQPPIWVGADSVKRGHQWVIVKYFYKKDDADRWAAASGRHSKVQPV